jgi:integrase
VDLSGTTATLQVRRTLSETRAGHKFEKPKNGKGRSIRCSQKATEALRSHRARQNEERLRVGSLWQDNGLVFPTTTGTTMNCTNLLGRHFKPLLKRAELPASRLHDLRHTCATILLMAGKHLKYVHELLGHASISITLDTYSHVFEGTAGSGTLWTTRCRGLREGLLLPHCCHRGFWLHPKAENPAYISRMRP